MPELNIARNVVEDGVCVLALTGFLDAHTFEQLDEALGELYDDGLYRIIADLSGIEYISSAGAGVFIGSLATVQENGGDIVLVNPTPNVREVFDLLGLTQIFKIKNDINQAVAVLGA